MVGPGSPEGRLARQAQCTCILSPSPSHYAMSVG